MDIRPALPSEAPALATLGAQLFRATYAGQIPDLEIEHHVAEVFRPECQAADISAPGGGVLLAVDGASLAGYAKLRPSKCPCPFPDPAPLEVARFYLQAPWHGTGLAAQLMEACLDWAAAQGYASLWLQAWEANPRALRFYEKARFLDYGETTFQVGAILYRDRVLGRALR